MRLLPVVSIATLSISSASAENFEPAPYNLSDGFSIVPQVTSTVRYDDNIYKDEDNETSSSIFIITPSFSFGTDDGINQYGGTYQLTSAAYANSSKDNFIDQELSLLAHTEYSAKHRTDFAFGIANLHEDRGSGITEGSANTYDEPLKYNEYTARGYYQFGGLNSIMRIGGGAQYANKTYKNFTDDTQFNDVNGLKFFTDADYQISDITFLTLDLYTTDIQYDHLEAGTESSDNRDTRSYLGFKWEGLSKTTGTMKAGYQYKSFESDERETFSGYTVDLGITWQPVEHSSFTAHINRSAEDSDTIGDYIEELGASIVWEHEWNEQLSTDVEYLFNNDDYVGAIRNDDIHSALFYLNYDFTRWLRITAGYEFTSKDSNTANISYDKNAVNLGVVVSL